MRVKAFDLRRSERTRKENSNMHEISANSEAAFNTIRENYKRTSHYTTAHQQNLKHGATCREPREVSAKMSRRRNDDSAN